MKSKILILAPYPDERYKADGMISRIKHIDNLLIDAERTYMYVSFFKNKYKYYQKSTNLEIFELNIFIHFFLIFKILFNSDKLYVHSIYQIRHIWFLIPFYKNKIYLDVHGVVPEEIKYFTGDTASFYYMTLIEKIIFRKPLLTIICVTNNMIAHFKNKYKNFHCKYILYNIFPDHLKNINVDKLVVEETDKQTVIIYSGSCALWQNIDIMLDLIKLNLKNSYKFIILSTNIDEFKDYLIKKNIQQNVIEIRSVKPEELMSYYINADYGFVLRDENIVNSVANPTKMIEYLAFGITPIVLNKNIGDYLNYGYDFVTIDQFTPNNYLKKGKSLKNILIAKKMSEENFKTDFYDLIFKDAKN